MRRVVGVSTTTNPGKHMRALLFDSEGRECGRTTTAETPAPSGVWKLLHSDSVVAVEVHYRDGSSVEYGLLDD